MALLDAIKKLFGGAKKDEVNNEVKEGDLGQEAPVQEEVATEAPAEEVEEVTAEESSSEEEKTKEY